jgi:proline iminopeptidase
VINLTEEKSIEQGEPGGWMTWGMYISMGQRHDYRDLMRKVTAPVLVIHGSDDLQSEEASRLYSDTFPSAKFAVISGAGHFSFQEKPEEFSGIVEEFIKK